MKRVCGWFVASLLVYVGASTAANPVITDYQTPPPEISALLTAMDPPTPVVHVSSRQVALLHYEKTISMKRLTMPRLGLAGLRYDPVSGLTGIAPLVHRVEIASLDGQQQPLPAWELSGKDAGFGFVQFSPDGKHLSALMSVTGESSKLAIYDIAARRQRIHNLNINPGWGNPCQWVSGERLLCLTRLDSQARAPTPHISPITGEHKGRAIPTRTYANLLTDDYSEQRFSYYFSSELTFIDTSGTLTPVEITPGLISDFRVSPDGEFVILKRIEAPYSHLLPASQFAQRVEVWSIASRSRLYQSQLQGAGIRGDYTGDANPDSIAWGPGLPVTAGYIHSEIEAGAIAYSLRTQTAPFAGEAKTIATSAEPIIEFGWTSAGTPWYITAPKDTNTTRVYVVLKDGVKLVREHKATDPGGEQRVVRVNGSEGSALELDGKVFVVSEDNIDDRPVPHLDSLDLASGNTDRLFTSEAGAYESVIAIVDTRAEEILTSREDEATPPVLSRVRGDHRNTVYAASNPFPQLDDIVRKRITYKRKDGIDLSATIYLPKSNQSPLPTLVWVYPYEYNDPERAQQIDARQFRFHSIVGASPIAAALSGYAVVVNPSMPIVLDERGGEDGYLPQLLASADALVEYLVKSGISDGKKIVIGGHSYGAFSSANLLIHSDKFAAGISRSGAYNRTLTPFGFQHERRTFWEAADYYMDISPFFHSDKLAKPILLLHGGADPNPGTPVIQARRFYQALAGEGATVRYVELPFEEHHYRGRESILHTSWEMINWLDVNLKSPVQAGEN